MNRFQSRARVRALATATIAALGATAIVAIPAAAAEGCDGLAGSAAELNEELVCAGTTEASSYTITLTTDFDVPAGAVGAYTGTADLVIDGDGHRVAGLPAIPDGPDERPLFTLGNLGFESESSLELSTFDVEIRNLEATNFTHSGVVASFTTGDLVLDTVSFHGNSAVDGAFDEVPLIGGSTTAAGSVTVRNSIFVDNEGLLGGAISTFAATFVAVDDFEIPSLRVAESHFEDNVGFLGGGALVSTGLTTISDSQFIDNSAPMGGAIATLGTTDSVLTVTDSEFRGNTAELSDGVEEEAGDQVLGGAVLSAIDTVVTNSTFADNSSANTAGTLAVLPIDWGADESPSLTVADSTITGSSAGNFAAAIMAEGDFTMTGTTVSGSEGPEAVVAANANAIVEGSTFSNNRTGNGATVVLSPEHEGTVSVTNSTFADNHADGDAGMGALAVGVNGTAWLAHNTFTANTGVVANDLVSWFNSGEATLHGNVFSSADQAPSCALEGDTSTAFNFDADGSCTSDWSGTGDIGEGLDTQLGALANNGGATQTRLPLEGSPLIDAIPTQAGSPVTVDQRGVTRPQGDGYDIGAVEVAVAVDTDGDGDGDGDGDDSGGGGPEGPQSGTDVVNFQVKTDAGIVFGSVSPAVAVTDINWTSTANLTGAPANTALPYGAAGFTIEVFEPGQSVTVTLTAPTPFTSAYKVSDDTWTQIPGATFSDDGTAITYTVTDGGDLDEDGQANGFIVDPVALAVQATFTG